MENNEKRQYPRKPALYPVKMVFHGQEYEGTLLNVSKEGAFLKMTDRGNLPSGQIHAEIQLVEPEQKILQGFQASGTLIRAFAGEDGHFYCAVRFLDHLGDDRLASVSLPVEV